MKYRHSFHAGNFADIHKHVTLLALLAALKRKDKGFAYIETHAGRGVYELSRAGESAEGSGRFSSGEYHAAELQNFATLLSDFRAKRHDPRAYPGSPAVAAHELRPQDRAVLCEVQPAEARHLERETEFSSRVHVECVDGYERLRALLPPAERRGLIFLDPPYEEPRQDLERVTATLADALRRFSTGVFAAWYPIKDERSIRAWHEAFARTVAAETLVSELWLYPRDSKVALNGSGVLIVNPPFQVDERMRVWLPELQARLDVGHPGGTSVTKLTPPA